MKNKVKFGIRRIVNYRTFQHLLKNVDHHEKIPEVTHLFGIKLRGHTIKMATIQVLNEYFGYDTSKLSWLEDQDFGTRRQASTGCVCTPPGNLGPDVDLSPPCGSPACWKNLNRPTHPLSPPPEDMKEILSIYAKKFNSEYFKDIDGYEK